MLTYFQRMKNKNQQLLNDNQRMSNRDLDGEEGVDSNDKLLFEDQWIFLDHYSTLFRKSSLMLVVTLGREYTVKFHVRDLSRLLNYDVSLISKNLKKLENLGLVNRENVGNLVFYQANMDSVLLRHMKICFTLMELNDLIKTLGPVSTNSILYGSCAKGEDTSASDIDLFIETIEKEKVSTILNDFQNRIHRVLSPVITTPDETYRMKMEDKNFHASINQGIILKEGEHVF